MDLYKSSSPDIEWKIHNVIKERLTEGKSIESNSFEISFDDEKVTKWHFFSKIEDSHLGLFLYIQEPIIPGISTKCEFFIRTLNNEKDRNLRFEKDSSTFKGGWGRKSWIPLSLLFENADKYLKNRTLRIGAKIELLKPSVEEPANEASTTVCRHVDIFEHYFNTKIFSDLTFVCSDNIEVLAHRFALAASSPIFKTMTESIQQIKIEVEDIDSLTMNEILRYAYTKKVNDIVNFVPKLIYGAEKYGLDGLKEICAASMIKNLSVENAVDYFILADQYNIKDLLDHCIKFIKINHQNLVSNEVNWDKLDKKHLNMILAYFKQNPEYVLILESSFSKF